jgi:hypothetical protein
LLGLIGLSGSGKTMSILNLAISILPGASNVRLVTWLTARLFHAYLAYLLMYGQRPRLPSIFNPLGNA